MSSNYPPGVTGNELAISGPDETYRRDWCDACQAMTPQTVYSHPEIETTAECGACGEEWEIGDGD